MRFYCNRKMCLFRQSHFRLPHGHMCHLLSRQAHISMCVYMANAVQHLYLALNSYAVLSSAFFCVKFYTHSGYIHFVLHCCLFRVVIFSVCLFVFGVLSVGLWYCVLSLLTTIFSLLFSASFSFISLGRTVGYFFASRFCICLYLPFHLTYFISIYVRNSSLAHAVESVCILCIYSNESQNSNPNRIQAALPIYGFFNHIMRIS